MKFGRHGAQAVTHCSVPASGLPVLCRNPRKKQWKLHPKNFSRTRSNRGTSVLISSKYSIFVARARTALMKNAQFFPERREIFTLPEALWLAGPH
jgi:hypothetical protein